jgi:hypothetical protein
MRLGIVIVQEDVVREVGRTVIKLIANKELIIKLLLLLVVLGVMGVMVKDIL